MRGVTVAAPWPSVCIGGSIALHGPLPPKPRKAMEPPMHTDGPCRVEAVGNPLNFGARFAAIEELQPAEWLTHGQVPTAVMLTFVGITVVHGR
jgi:hypothetical protein